MSKTINILQNKKLVLKNVIRKRCNHLPNNSIDEEVKKFQNTLLAHNPSAFGPLIICNRGSHVSESGEISVDIDILVQAREYKKMKDIFDIEESIECKNCIVAQYEDDAEHIPMVFSKLDVFIYENDLIPTGIMYTLYKDSSSHHTALDIFKQVESI